MTSGGSSFDGWRPDMRMEDSKGNYEHIKLPVK